LLDTLPIGRREEQLSTVREHDLPAEERIGVQNEGQATVSRSRQQPHQTSDVVSMAMTQNDGVKVARADFQDVHIVEEALPGQASVKKEGVLASSLRHCHETREAVLRTQNRSALAKSSLDRHTPDRLASCHEKVEGQVKKGEDFDPVDLG